MDLATMQQRREWLSDLRALTGADQATPGEGKYAFSKNQFSPKQRRYLAYRLQGLSNPDAAKRAGYKTSGGGLQVWKKMKTNEQIIAAFEAIGITPEEIGKKVHELLNCTTLIRVSEGDAREVPDNTNRNKALQIAVDVVGGFAPKHETVTIQTFERKVELLEQIRENPELLDSMKQRLIEIKKTKGEGDGSTD
jgi:hypothetical protein